MMIYSSIWEKDFLIIIERIFEFFHFKICICDFLFYEVIFTILFIEILIFFESKRELSISIVAITIYDESFEGKSLSDSFDLVFYNFFIPLFLA